MALPLIKRHIELLQYTGFKDIAKREIYEGDIVWDSTANMFDLEDKYQPIYPIFYEVYFAEGQGSWSLKIDKLEHAEFTLANKRLKIMGNIYENPELLK